MFPFCVLVNAAENIKKWWKWGVWSSPLMYAHTSIMVNEFLAKSWRHVSSWIFHVNICVYLCLSAKVGWWLNIFFSECIYKFNSIPMSRNIKVSRFLHRVILVLARSWGTDWILDRLQHMLYHGSHLPRSWASLFSLLWTHKNWI